MENEQIAQKNIKLKKFYDESENRVETNAIVYRAYIDKISKETIESKVNAQMNSIKAGIYSINPKFKEGSKNYDETKALVLKTLSNYEKALIELSEFYDGKIEQLILRRVELEAGLVGSLLNDEYLSQKFDRKNYQKENDKVKKSVKENIKLAIEKLKGRKNSNEPVDPISISKLMDQQDVVTEIDSKLTDRIEKTISDQNVNSEFMSKVEKEISMINSEIQRINEQKKQSIFDAMEVGEKEITTNIRKPRVFSKITRFFVSRFNTPKIVESTILNPLNLRIESFVSNELSAMKG